MLSIDRYDIIRDIIGGLYWQGQRKQVATLYSYPTIFMSRVLQFDPVGRVRGYGRLKFTQAQGTQRSVHVESA